MSGHTSRLVWGLLGAGALTAAAGCATGAPPQELLDARYAVQQASVGPAQKEAAAALAEAREALAEADRLFDREGASEETRSWAYVAHRKAQRAEALARSQLAERERAAANARRDAALQARGLKSQQELEQTRAQLTEAQRLQAEAQARADELARRQEEERSQREQAERDQTEQQRLAAEQRAREEEQRRIDEARAEAQRTGQQLSQVQQQLEAERQARQQAEARIRQAEQAEQQARAEAQRREAEAAQALRNVERVQVRETPRGTVVTLSGSVLFASGKSTLLPSARQRLDQVAEALRSAPNVLVVEGHTDSKGGTMMNEELSYRRASAVRDYLVGQGVPAERIRAQGLGEDAPVADNATAEGRANNRRVEIVLQRLPEQPQRGLGGSGREQQQEPQQPAQENLPAPRPLEVPQNQQ